MRRRIENFFNGRQGMDELSKLLFWGGIAGFALAVILGGSFGSFLSTFAIMSLIISFVRAFSRNLPMREAENMLLLRWKENRRREAEARKNRWKSRKDYKYFKCPSCGKWLRVPRHKGKIHISCKCGYTLYRRT